MTTSPSKRKQTPQELAALEKGRGLNDRKRYSYERIAQVVRIMMTGGHTTKQLRKIAGLSQTSAGNFVTAFHKAGCTHIIGYDRGKGNRLGGAIYKWGVGDDAELPKKVSATERARRTKRQLATPTIETLWPSPIRRSDDASHSS